MIARMPRSYIEDAFTEDALMDMAAHRKNKKKNYVLEMAKSKPELLKRGLEGGWCWRCGGVPRRALG